MDNQFLSPPRQGRNRAIAAAVGIAALIGVAVVIHSVSNDQRRTPAAVTPSTLAPTGTDQDPDSVTGVSTDGSPAPGTQPPLRLVQGTRVVNGISVGYPHTLVGAVSAATEYATQVLSTLDPQRAVQIGQAVADRSYTDAGTDFTRGPSNTRRQLGLPTDGPVPVGASQTLGVVAYQIRDPQADEATVLLLSYLTSTTPTTGIETTLMLLPLRMRWADGDWKLAKRPKDAQDYPELLHKPGSPQAHAAGWQDLTQ